MPRRSVVPLLALVLAFVVCGMLPHPAMGAQEKPAQKAAVTGQAAPETPVNINTATAAELEKLPGIGPKIAQEIVTHREAKGAFKSTEELKQVKGVGEKKYEAIRSRITVE